MPGDYIGNPLHKEFDCELGRFLDTDVRYLEQKFHHKCFANILLKISKSNDKTSSLQFDLCNQSMFKHY